MKICGMFGHKVKEKDGKIHLHVDDSKSFEFGNFEKYLQANGEMCIKLEGRTRTLGQER